MKARNGQKKAPADRRKRQKTPKSSFLAKKSACGKPPAEENGPFPRETLFGPKKKRLRQAASQKRSKMPTFFAEKTAKNTKIFTKWSSIQHFAMIPRRKCTEKQDLQESDRVIAPKPLK